MLASISVTNVSIAPLQAPGTAKQQRYADLPG
jgi:hypothetical protein